VTDAKYSLCPKGAELADVQNGATLDADISLYVTRLCHTNALTKLVQLIGEGGVGAHELIEVNDDGGAKIRGRLTFQSALHMLTFAPSGPLRPATMYTVTLKQTALHLKKEVPELGDDDRKTLRDIITEPQFCFTFTTTDSPWRKLAVYRRFRSAQWPTDLSPLGVAWTVVLKNADEVVEGLKVLTADALGVDEDDDILSLHSITFAPNTGSLQLAAVDHSNVSGLTDDDMILATLKEAGSPAKRPRTDKEPQPAQLGGGATPASASGAQSSSSEGGGSSNLPERRSARERLTELKDLLDSGLISQQDFAAKKQDILNSL
jgi:hypothetical protein